MQVHWCLATCREWQHASGNACIPATPVHACSLLHWSWCVCSRPAAAVGHTSQAPGWLLLGRCFFGLTAVICNSSQLVWLNVATRVKPASHQQGDCYSTTNLEHIGIVQRCATISVGAAHYLCVFVCSGRPHKHCPVAAAAKAGGVLSHCPLAHCSRQQEQLQHCPRPTNTQEPVTDLQPELCPRQAP